MRYNILTKYAEYINNDWNGHYVHWSASTLVTIIYKGYISPGNPDGKSDGNRNVIVPNVLVFCIWYCTPKLYMTCANCMAKVNLACNSDYGHSLVRTPQLIL